MLQRHSYRHLRLEETLTLDLKRCISFGQRVDRVKDLKRQTWIGFNSKHLFKSFGQHNVWHLPWSTCSECSVLAWSYTWSRCVIQKRNHWALKCLNSDDGKCRIEIKQLITVSENFNDWSRDNTRGYTCREHPSTALHIHLHFYPRVHHSLSSNQTVLLNNTISLFTSYLLFSYPIHTLYKICYSGGFLDVSLWHPRCSMDSIRLWPVLCTLHRVRSAS